MTADIVTVFFAEFLRRIRSRAFKLGVAIGLVAIFFFIKAPAFFGGAFEGSNTIVVVGEPSIAVRATALLARDYRVASTVAPQPVTRAMLREHDSAAAVVLKTGNRGLAVVIYALGSSSVRSSQVQRDLLPLQLELRMHLPPQEIATSVGFPVELKLVDSRFTSTAQALSAQAIGLSLLFILYFLIVTNSQLVMTSVAEEKSSRIAESLVACVDTSALLVGKVGACAVLALIQLTIWIAVGALLSVGGGSSSGVSNGSLANLFEVVTPGALVAFLLFFVLGFLQLSTMLAAFASLINRTEDLGSIAAPVFPLIVSALFVALPALTWPDAGWAVAFSFVPLFAPFVMVARTAVSNVPFWQVFASLIINAGALWLIAVLGGKLYRVGMLLYGRPPRWSQVLTILRT